MAQALIEAGTTESFDLSRYKDDFHARLAKLVEGKARKVKRAPAKGKSEPGIINLMDALRRSLDDAKKGLLASKKGSSASSQKSSA